MNKLFSVTALFLLLSAARISARDVSPPLRTIAILENERMTAAEPDIRLASFFRSADAAVRARAALAAGRIGNKDLVPQLAMLVGDPSPEVRKMTAFALGQIRAKEGLPATAQLMKDRDPEVRRLAIEAWGRIGGIENTGGVLPFLDDPRPSLREQAGLALALIKDRAAVDPLLRKIRDHDPAQWSYVYALYRLADERSIPALHQVLANPEPSPSTGDPSSVLFALKALWSMKKPLTAEEAAGLLGSADARIQQNALDVLGASGDAAACDFIRPRLETFPVASKWKALDAMATLGCATEAERTKYLAAPEPELRASALRMLNPKDAGPYQATIESASRDDSWIVRSQAADSCAALSAEAALPILQKLFADTDSSVRLSAFETMGGFLPQAEQGIIAGLNNEDAAIRSLAVEALAKSKDRKYLPLLLETYRKYEDIDTRTSVLDALPDLADGSALGVIESALQDPAYAMRRHAVDALKKISGGSAYFLHGKVVDLDRLPDLPGKVSAQVFAGYPADYGLPFKDREALLQLARGTVRIRLLSSQAPVHVKSFIQRAQQGLYNNLRIHRVVPNFVIQGGDPRGDGWGRGGILLADQFNTEPYLRGKVGMPTAGKDTGGAQFFITMSRQPHLDGNYTVFGEVIAGMEFVDATELGDRIVKVEILPE